MSLVMFLWYAYQAEVQVYGAGNTWTAQNCPGTGGRACTFDQLLRHIQHTGPNSPAWTESTPLGNTLDLDVMDTAERLNSQ